MHFTRAGELKLMASPQDERFAGIVFQGIWVTAGIEIEFFWRSG
jgi:hypothetical protein